MNSTPLLMRSSPATLVLATGGFPAMPPILIHRVRFSELPIRRRPGQRALSEAGSPWTGSSGSATPTSTLAGARTITGEALPVAIELAILTLFGAVTYGIILFAFRPRTLRAFWC